MVPPVLCAMPPRRPGLFEIDRGEQPPRAGRTSPWRLRSCRSTNLVVHMRLIALAKSTECEERKPCRLKLVAIADPDTCLDAPATAIVSGHAAFGESAQRYISSAFLAVGQQGTVDLHDIYRVYPLRSNRMADGRPRGGRSAAVPSKWVDNMAVSALECRGRRPLSTTGDLDLRQTSPCRLSATSERPALPAAAEVTTPTGSHA